MTRIRLSLDGAWRFWTDPRGEFGAHMPIPGRARTVNVPAPWQSQADELRDYTGVAWYRKNLQIPNAWLKRGCVILGFDAVDYFAEVWVNARRVGAHEGGYLPFTFDITNALQTNENFLTVRVDDPPEIFSEIPHGKQSWYGMLSGIWRSVWLEWRAETFIERVHITPRAEQVTIEVTLNRALDAHHFLRYEIVAPNGECVAAQQSDTRMVSLTVTNPQLWKLDSPNLYAARVTLFENENTPLDSLQDSFGFRRIEAREGKLWLNGRPIYLRGTLDQDYYPELISSTPSLEYIENEFRQAKALGLNCLRLHIKVGDERYYQVADRMGILIWTELPNWIALTDASKQRARATLEGILERDWNHPSIVIWTLINEGWGVNLSNPQERAWLAETYAYVKTRDPFRLVVGNSACRGNFHVATDILDFHNYYAMPDHYDQWRAWVQNFSQRPDWTFAHEYKDYAAWRAFLNNPWASVPRLRAPEAQLRGDEPLLVSEFGNWGLPDIEQLLEGYGGKEPWWFETGQEFRDAVVYPHGVQERFRVFHLQRAFSSLTAFARATQRHQFCALKYQIEQLRLEPNIQGYVITEFTDAHWECNGLLDMHRNLKPPLEPLADLNADDVLIAEWTRIAFWSGEECMFPLSLSHYSEANLTDSRIEWELSGFAECTGVLTNISSEEYSVTSLGAMTFAAPSVACGTRATLEFKLVTADDNLAARNQLELYFFPRHAHADKSTRVYSPMLSAGLASIGYSVTNVPHTADIIVTTALTDDLRALLLDGACVLLLGETPAAMQTFIPSLEIVGRQDTSWQGDWVSSFSWLNRDKLFRDIPTDGVLDFGFADLTPEAVLTGFRPFEFDTNVHAGLTVGWLHRTAALVGERRVGRGWLLASTFRLAEHFTTHPIAAQMLRDMLNHLKWRNRG